mmetsp:Transcript_12912/g.37926  ORF Transcript_12912/g.37926 Transcript_12912/m.37926 type:complete len:253 (+) Transcript_12912:1320-2078(+)
MPLHNWIVQDLVDARPAPLVHDKELGDDVVHVLGVVARDGLVLAPHHLAREAVHGVGVEGRLEGEQFVKQAAKRPHVALVVVGAVLPHLGGHVVGRAHLGAREGVRGLEHLGDAKVAEFYVLVVHHEDVGALEVAVQDVLLVEALQAVAHLDEEGPDGLLPQQPAAFARLEPAEEVAVGRVLRDDVEDVRVHKRLEEADVEWTAHGREDTNLVHRFGALLIVHAACVHLFNSVHLRVRLAHGLIHRTIRPLA